MCVSLSATVCIALLGSVFSEVPRDKSQTERDIERKTMSLTSASTESQSLLPLMVSGCMLNFVAKV